MQHRDAQFEVRDLRAFSTKISPELRFGYEASGKRANATVAKGKRFYSDLHRYVCSDVNAGDIRGNTFVFGDDCGIVRVWDLRNTKNVVQKVRPKSVYV